MVSPAPKKPTKQKKQCQTCVFKTSPETQKVSIVHFWVPFLKVSGFLLNVFFWFGA